MAQSAPGKHHRKGITILEATRMFPDDLTAEAWFVENRWPNGVACPRCGSLNILHVKSRKPQPFRCRDCRKCFSVKTGTLMHGSNLGLQTWALAFYLLATGLKGTASLKLHRDLGVTQKTAWYLAHRIRETWQDGHGDTFSGQVEADETYIGGKVGNMSNRRRKHYQGRGPTSNKITVAGVKERKTNRIKARVIQESTHASLRGFVYGSTEEDSTVFTDSANAYKKLERKHKSVNHTARQYVDGQAHTNGLESFWSLMKRGYHGTYHYMSEKHLHRYVAEFEGRYNQRPLDTVDQMKLMVRGIEGKQLRYADLIEE